MKDTCADISIYLSGYQDGELNEERHRRVSTHLTRCDACRASLAELERLTTGLRRVEDVEASFDFTAEVMGHILENETAAAPARPDRSNRFGWFSSPALVYSLVFIVFCLLGFLINPSLRPPALETVEPPSISIAMEADLNDLTAYSNALTESQQLNLIDVQEQSLDLLAADSTSRSVPGNEVDNER